MRTVKNINNINFDYFEFAMKGDVLNNKKDFRNFYITFISFIILINSIVFNISLPFNFLLATFSVLVYFLIISFYNFFIKKNILKYINAFEGLVSGLITLSLFIYIYLFLNSFYSNISYISQINFIINSVLEIVDCSLFINIYNSYLTLVNELVGSFNVDINFVSFSKKNVFMFVDNFDINLSTFIYFFLFLFAVVLSFGILISKNPINSLLFLISTYVYSSIILILFKLEFFGLLYVIIYVGAIAVLFLFVIMMLKFEKLPEYKVQKSNLFSIFYILLLGFLSFVFFKFYNNNFIELIKYSRANKGVWYDYDLNKYFNIGETINDLEDLGLVFYTEYAHAFLVCGLILLISIIAPILLTFKVRKGLKEQYHSEQLSRDKKYIISLRDNS